jgi:hypothetical protein
MNIPEPTMTEAAFKKLDARRKKLKDELAELNKKLKPEDDRRELLAYKRGRDRGCRMGAHLIYSGGKCNNCGTPDDGFDI